jgi:hypothetical protein
VPGRQVLAHAAHQSGLPERLTCFETSLRYFCFLDFSLVLEKEVVNHDRISIRQKTFLS